MKDALSLGADIFSSLRLRNVPPSGQAYVQAFAGVVFTRDSG
jgi:hypothetical protein